ncbi:MAG: divalent-cation tolerance protein CutA [Candidatus Brocadiia bacterium]
MYIVVFVTVPSAKIAGVIATAVVQAKLAACVNIILSIRSVYKWKGKLCRDKEALMVIKTKKTLFPKLADKIRVMHPYQVPEIIGLPIIAGNKPYLKWLNAAVKTR